MLRQVFIPLPKSVNEQVALKKTLRASVDAPGFGNPFCKTASSLPCTFECNDLQAWLDTSFEANTGTLLFDALPKSVPPHNVYLQDAARASVYPLRA